jgi:hypothetical protein
MREARTPADRDAAHQQLRRSTSGKLGEAIAADGLGALGKVELQRTVTLPNATTIVDGRLTATTNPLVLGRGVFIEKGGSLSWEAKARAAENLGTELRTHVAGLQVPGHLALGDKSIVLVSRDIYQVSGEAAARQAVKESGSYVMALLPEKRVMDEALMRVIRARLERA